MPSAMVGFASERLRTTPTCSSPASSHSPFDNGQDVCTVNAEGVANGYMVSTLARTEPPAAKMIPTASPSSAQPAVAAFLKNVPRSIAVLPREIRLFSRRNILQSQSRVPEILRSNVILNQFGKTRNFQFVVKYATLNRDITHKSSAPVEGIKDYRPQRAASKRVTP